MISDLLRQAQQLSSEIIRWRRHLHTIPELKMETVQTEAYIAGILKELGVEDIRTGIGGHGICATIKGALPGPCLAIRADCDGLPIQEETGLPFASKNGNMHACGHDAHTAMALGATKLLLAHRDQLRGTVKMIFQPYEEGDGGAKAMIDDGVLEGVDGIIALHNHCTPDEDYAPGDILVCPDSTSAGIFAYEATFHGPGGHVCHSRSLPNPVYMACRAVARIAALPEPGPETVNAVTVISGGARNNIVPDSCTIAGSVRAFDRDNHNKMRQQVLQILEEESAEGSVEIRTTIDLMATRIDPELYGRFCKVVDRLCPENPCIQLKKRDMIGEDFARFADRLPALYFFLHTRPENSCYPLHNPKFDVNEAVLYKGSAVFAAFALHWQES